MGMSNQFRPAEPSVVAALDYQQIKSDLHRKILDRLNLEKLGRAPSETAREEVLAIVRNAIASESIPLSFAERECARACAPPASRHARR